MNELIQTTKRKEKTFPKQSIFQHWINWQLNSHTSDDANHQNRTMLMHMFTRDILMLFNVRYEDYSIIKKGQFD